LPYTLSFVPGQWDSPSTILGARGQKDLLATKPRRIIPIVAIIPPTHRHIFRVSLFPSVVGCTVGPSVIGSTDGPSVGLVKSPVFPSSVGEFVGEEVGELVGEFVGELVGELLGSAV